MFHTVVLCFSLSDPRSKGYVVIWMRRLTSKKLFYYSKMLLASTVLEDLKIGLAKGFSSLDSTRRQVLGVSFIRLCLTFTPPMRHFL